MIPYGDSSCISTGFTDGFRHRIHTEIHFGIPPARFITRFFERFVLGLLQVFIFRDFIQDSYRGFDWDSIPYSLRYFSRIFYGIPTEDPPGIKPGFLQGLPSGWLFKGVYPVIYKGFHQRFLQGLLHENSPGISFDSFKDCFLVFFFKYSNLLLDHFRKFMQRFHPKSRRVK